jgi:hypothetical protein
VKESSFAVFSNMGAVHFHLRVKPAAEVLGVLNTSNNIAANTNIVEVDFFELLPSAD